MKCLVGLLVVPTHGQPAGKEKPLAGPFKPASDATRRLSRRGLATGQLASPGPLTRIIHGPIGMPKRKRGRIIRVGAACAAGNGAADASGCGLADAPGCDGACDTSENPRLMDNPG